jgi:hypothetical protein
MPRDPETRLGPYEIVRTIGAGGWARFIGHEIPGLDVTSPSSAEEMTSPTIQLVVNWPASLDK